GWGEEAVTYLCRDCVSIPKAVFGLASCPVVPNAAARISDFPTCASLACNRSCAEAHTKSPAARPRGFDATGDSKIAAPQYLATQGFSPVRCLELFAALCHSFFLFE